MKIKRVVLILGGLSPLIFAGCYGYPGRGGMGFGNHMMGYGGGGIFMWLLLIGAALAVVYFAVNRTDKSGRPDKSGFLERETKETPLETLRKRYARGEITKEEFDDMKRDIEA